MRPALLVSSHSPIIQFLMYLKYARDFFMGIITMGTRLKLPRIKQRQ